MGIFNGLRKALLLDRLGRQFGVDMSASDHRSKQLSQVADETVASVFADIAAGTTAIQRHLAESRERQYPGYKAELNRERSRLGLPPL